MQTEAEAKFVMELHTSGASVVPAIPRYDGLYATLLNASEGPRPALLFEAAPPISFSAEDITNCRELGSAVARLHEMSDALNTKYDLETFSPSTVADQRLPYTREHVTTEEYDFLSESIAQVDGQLRGLPGYAPHFGPCHGDLALSNIRRKPDGSIVFFDFGDVSNMWRAYELAATLGRLPGNGLLAESDHQNAFIAGYTSVRDLPAGMPDQALPLMLLRKLLWFCSAFAACPLRMGTENFGRRFIDTYLPPIRELVGIPVDV
jgi:Ser/Thr protein kinase RdoA (MazF antagonist)